MLLQNVNSDLCPELLERCTNIKVLNIWMFLTNAGHCTFPQPGKLVAHCMPRVSYSDDFSLSCSAGEWGHPLPRNFSSPYPQWEASPLSFPTHSLEKCSLKGHLKKPSSHVQHLISACVLCQEWVKAIRATTKAKILNIISCKWPFSGFLCFTVLLSARAPGPSKPGARF